MVQTTAQKAPTSVFAFTEWRQRVGIEREYKWSFEPTTAERVLAGRDVSEALQRLALPDGFRVHKPYEHWQETIYLDDAWRLLDHETSIAVVINRGPTGEQAYIKVKQTIGWSGLRRDAVEIAERVDSNRIAEAVSSEPVLPVQYVSRQYAGELALRPFATTEQQRWKLTVWSDRGTPLVVCWDECRIEAVDSDARVTAHCVEVESNMLDDDSCVDLDRLADAVADFLGMAPSVLSKSRRAAALSGR